MNLRESRSTGMYSVGDLTSVIKTVLEGEFSEVLVKGEISNFKQHTSGHRYFTLKDSYAQISCVMWRTRSLPFEPTDGMSVVVGGRVTVYPVRGNYQLDCEFIRADGVGALYKAFELLKVQLQERGWFDETRKRALPRFPACIGIATSKTGAALQDMLTTINRRYGALHVLLRPTLVQGDGSAADIASAIADLNKAGAEAIIVGRGGGSIEDLWSFNTEIVARAIYESKVPVISAVGHETDFTIADFVADKRAPTPTAAAEFVTPFTNTALLQMIDELEMDMCDTMSTRTYELLSLVQTFLTGTTLERIADRLGRNKDMITAYANRLTMAAHRALQAGKKQCEQSVGALVAIHRNLENKQSYLRQLSLTLAAKHPHRPLTLGYAIVEQHGRSLPAHAQIEVGSTLRIIRWTQEATVTVHHTEQIHRKDTDGNG